MIPDRDPEVLQARIDRLERRLVDATGRPRAALYVDGQVAGLAISDPAGRTRLLLNTDGESTKLSIVGTKQGFPRINLAQQGDVQLLNLEDDASFIGLTHSGATPSIVVASKDNSAEIGIAESFAARPPKPAVGPSLVLKQGGQTVVSLPAAPAR